MDSQNKVASLFQAYYSELNRYLVRKFNLVDGADDVVQDAFHNIIHQNKMDEIENPRAYLYQTARNIAINKIKRQGFQEDYIASIFDDEELTASVDQEFVAEFNYSRVMQVLTEVSEKDRITFELNKIDGKSYIEISKELNVTVSAVEKRIMKVLYKLRKAISDE